MSTTAAPSRTVKAHGSPEEFLAHLDAKMQEALEKVELSEVWKVLTNPETDFDLAKAILREIHYEVATYQPIWYEASTLLAARLPRHDVELMRRVFMHQLDEADHGLMAYRDYIALGGSEEKLKEGRRSPAALCFNGMWWELARTASPFAYFGAVYPFEATTPIFTAKVQSLMTGRGIPESSLSFIVFHAEEDLAHGSLFRTMIKEVVAAYPEAAPEIEYGLDCFFTLYPLTMWTPAYERAVSEHKGR